MVKYLNEEMYQKNKSKIIKFGIIILISSLLIGGFLIYKGVTSPDEKKVSNLQNKLNEEKEILILKRNELKKEIKPVEEEIYNSKFNDNDYNNHDKIESLQESIIEETEAIEAINNALDDSYMYCHHNNTKNNEYTKNYCTIKNKLYTLTDKEYVALYYIGAALIIIIGLTFFIITIIIAKSREIIAFKVQEIMPIDKEYKEEMIPTYGKMAKEIAKSIKNGKGEE